MVMILFHNSTMSNCYILSIETATQVCSVSLSNNGRLVDSVFSNEPNMHATALTVFIQELLDKTGLTFQDLAAVSVSMGPGSYTGLRIGVSAAKGLCYALDIPLIGINSLEAMLGGYLMKHEHAGEKLMLCPMIDARRLEVYTAFFDADGTPLMETHALIVDDQTFDVYLKEGFKVVLFGAGADKFKEMFASKEGVTIVEGFESHAAQQGKRAYDKFKQQQFEDVAYFEPYYLKDFVVTKSKKNLLSS